MVMVNKKIKKIVPFYSSLSCILRKKNNNFFITVIKSNGTDVLFSKSCGMLYGVRGSKKYTTVSLESLGRETFFELFRLGYRTIDLVLILKFKVDKFVRSFIRGILSDSSGFVNLDIKIQLSNTHNGLRAKKQRRV